MTPDKVVEILKANGTQVTIEEAKVILNYLMRVAELEVSEFLELEKEKKLVSLRTVKNNNMKKKSKSTDLTPSGSEDKSLIHQAGELFGSIGEHITEAKDSVAGFVSDEVKVVKKAIKKVAKKIARKASAKKATPKKAARKVSSKSVVKKPVKKAAKKTAKKSSPKRK